MFLQKPPKISRASATDEPHAPAQETAEQPPAAAVPGPESAAETTSPLPEPEAAPPPAVLEQPEPAAEALPPAESDLAAAALLGNLNPLGSDSFSDEPAPEKFAPAEPAYDEPAPAELVRAAPAHDMPAARMAASVRRAPPVSSFAAAPTGDKATFGGLKKPPILSGESLVKGKVLQAQTLSSIPFADIWITPEKMVYTRDTHTQFALVPLETDDMAQFYKALEEGYKGSSSYSLLFDGDSYRIERIKTLTGIQFNCRKMMRKTPDITSLGLSNHVVNYLTILSRSVGLILFAGPTGMGKTTSVSALAKYFLETEGGFLYTIEDPPEMPLDGLYHAKNGALGLCKQTLVEDERWGDSLKSALRSHPRYILVGEIRTPETASQTLRAATSGHLVLSTVHASNVEDALNSVIKYAVGTGLNEGLVSDLLARGILAVIYQELEGVEVQRPVVHAAFANPDLMAADQMRMSIRDRHISLSTLMEAQTAKLLQGKPLFK